MFNSDLKSKYRKSAPEYLVGALFIWYGETFYKIFRQTGYRPLASR